MLRILTWNNNTGVKDECKSSYIQKVSVTDEIVLVYLTSTFSIFLYICFVYSGSYI